MYDMPDQLIARLLILNPAYDAADARKAISLLYANPPEWVPLCDMFSIPQWEARRWFAVARAGHDVSPHIVRFLDTIGVTEELLQQLLPHLPPPPPSHPILFLALCFHKLLRDFVLRRLN